jgi:hypothetical protein
MRKVAFGLAAFTLPLASFAAVPAVTDTVTEIGTYAAPVAAIGLAVLAVVLAVKGVKWFRRAL